MQTTVRAPCFAVAAFDAPLKNAPGVGPGADISKRRTALPPTRRLRPRFHIKPHLRQRFGRTAASRINGGQSRAGEPSFGRDESA